MTAKYNADLAVAQANLNAANANLSQVKSQNAIDIQGAYEDLYASSWAAVIDSRTGIAQADEVLGVRDGTANDDFESVLGVRSASALSSAKIAFEAAEKARDNAESLLLSSSQSSTNSQKQAVADLAIIAIEKTAKLLLYTHQVVEATLPTSNFTTLEHAALKDSIAIAQDGVQATSTAILTSNQAVQLANISTSSLLEDTKNALDQSKGAYDAAKALRDQQIGAAEHVVETAVSTKLVKEMERTRSVASFNEVKADPRDVDLASFEAEVSRAQAALSAAKARLDNTMITSPIAGVVTDVAFDIGEQVQATVVAVKVQTTKEQFEIVFNIPESDITKVSMNDEAILTFDAFGTDQEFAGSITELDPAEKLIEGVVYYEATILLDVEQPESFLRPGLTSDGEISTAHIKQTIVIPQRAIQSKRGKSHVRILVDEEPVEREVEVGLRGDLGQVEILSGLAEGEELIIRELDE